MMGKDERECVKVPFGEYLKVPENNRKADLVFCKVCFFVAQLYDIIVQTDYCKVWVFRSEQKIFLQYKTCRLFFRLNK